MFKLESYITPFLVSYLDKYVKLQQEDFQLSLWGGDAVLNKLDLRLDALEGMLNLPITFVSGHIHELRLHVPWTKLGSEPVVITFNTIECVVKVRDTSKTKPDTETKTNESRKTPRQQEAATALQAGEDVPAPGYIQSIINRIVNNVNIVVNNLIVKFVEDDIVLSVNVKSVEYHSVNSIWQKSFIDLTPEDLVLRRLVSISDLTVCLDKRNTTGKIDAYQEPLLYKCSVSCRAHMQFESTTSKLPKRIKFSFLCHQFDMSLTDAQLPMFVRLYELFVAIWFEGYGTNARPARGSSSQSGLDVAESSAATDKEKEGSGDDEELVESDGGGAPSQQEGWVSWAWSYVPPILPQEDYEDFYDESSTGASSSQTPQDPPSLSFGFYVDRGTITFKTTLAVHNSPLYGPQKLIFRPILTLLGEGGSMEITSKGDALKGPFFSSFQLGLSAARAYGRGDCICGVKDHFEDEYTMMIPYFNSGCPPSAKGCLHFLTGSLFDELGPENRRVEPRLFLDRDSHMSNYCESFAIERFGAFWLDSVFSIELPEEPESLGEEDSVVAAPRPQSPQRETFGVRLLFGPAHSIVSSGLVHRLEKILFWAYDHQYEPYVLRREEEIRDMSSAEAHEEAVGMLDFVASRSYSVGFVHWKIRFFAADHGFCDTAVRTRPKKVFKESRRSNSATSKATKDSDKPKRPTSPLGGKTLPCFVVVFDRIDFVTSAPMYPFKVVAVVSSLQSASIANDLKHFAFFQNSINLFGMQFALSYIKPKMAPKSQPMHVISPPFSAALFIKTLIAPKLWKDSDPDLPHLGHMLECSQLQLSLSPPQLHLIMKILYSWIPPPSCPNDITRPLSLTHSPIKCKKSSQVLMNYLQIPIYLNPKPFQKTDTVIDDAFMSKQRLPALIFQFSQLQAKLVSNKDVLAATGGLGSASLSLQTYSAETGNDVSVTLLGVRDEPGNLEGLVERLKTQGASRRTPDAEWKSEEEVGARTDSLSFALQMPSRFDNIVDFDVRCRIVASFRSMGLSLNLDPALLSWLNYSPTLKPEKPKLTTSKSTARSSTTEVVTEISVGSIEDKAKRGKETFAPSIVASAASVGPVKSGSKLSGQGSTADNESTVTSYDMEEEAMTGDEDAAVDESIIDESLDAEEIGIWKRYLPTVYAILRRLEVNVKLAPSFVVIPRSIVVSSPTSSFLSSFESLYRRRNLPHCLCVVTPRVEICSASGKEFILDDGVEIPLPRLTDFVFTGDQLPWSLKLDNFAVFTVLSKPSETIKIADGGRRGKDSTSPSMYQDINYLLHPSASAGTVAISASGGKTEKEKVEPLLLSLCVHADLDTQIIAISNAQLKLLLSVSMEAKKMFTKMAEVAKFALYPNETLEEIRDDGESAGIPPDEPSAVKDEKQNNALNNEGQVLVQASTPRVPTTRLTNVSLVESSKECDSKPADIVESLSENQSTSDDELKSEKTDRKDRSLEPHLSLWAQCTLPKAVFKVYGQDQFARDLLLTAVLEDSDTSVDIQEVYSKIKVKIGTFEVKHFVRNDRREPWSAGPFLGTVVTSTPETITSSVQIVHDRVAYASISPATNFFAPLPRPLDKSRGFLALTFTSALCQNVQSKIKQSGGSRGRHAYDDAATAADASHSEGSRPRRYLHEICLKVQPCDIVLHSPLMVSLAKIVNIDPLAKLYTKLRPSAASTATAAADVVSDTSLKQAKVENALALSIFTSQLPLFYVTASSIRIFMPLEEKAIDGVEGNRVSWPFLPPPVRHDLMMFQIGEVSLVPQADNPLPRMVLDLDLFNRAVRRGKLAVPGSDVEDRQYQLDMSGINLSTGCWADFQAISHPVQYSSDGTSAPDCAQQNPAVEWNKLEAKDAENLGEGLKMQDDEKEIVAKVVPIATSFDLRVVAAPAVAVEHFEAGGDASSSPNRLVCGHSLEINATSDVDLFLGQHQLDLALDFLGVMIKSIFDFSDVFHENRSSSRRPATSRRSNGDHQLADAFGDSGIDSDVLSNYKLPDGNLDRKRKRGVSLFPKSAADASPVQPPPRSNDSACNFVPFDILLTANKICFHAYEYSTREAKLTEVTKREFFPEEDPYDADRSFDNKSGATLSRSPRIDNFQRYQDILSPSSSSSSLACSSYGFVLIPILNVNFAQPHSLVSCSPERQRIELSCFDASLRGSKPLHSVDNDDQLLPFQSDYEMPWIETKPGEPNAKTGILPSLYTIKVEDFVSLPAKISFIMDRPLCLTFSVPKFDLVAEGLNSLSHRILDHPTVELIRSRIVESPRQNQPFEAPSSAAPPFDELSRFSSVIGGVSLLTNQLVLRFEATSEELSTEETRGSRSSESRGKKLKRTKSRSQCVINDVSEPTLLTLSCSEFSANLSIPRPNSASNSSSSSSFECLLSTYDLNSSLERLGMRHQFFGPFHAQLSCILSNQSPDGGVVFPYHVVCHVTAGIIRVAFGQEHYFALERLVGEVVLFSQRVRSYLSSSRSGNLQSLPNSFNDGDGEIEVDADTSPQMPVLRPAEPTSSIDDLRSGAFAYVKDPEDGASLPNPWEIVFRTSGDSTDSSSSMTWRYPEVRALTAVQVSPIPFLIPDENQMPQRIPTAIPCILQFYDELKREFVNYRTFCLSESKSAILDLPSIHASDLQDVGISDVWRIAIKDQVLDKEDSSTSFPFSSFVPPPALAASARIDSCFSPNFSPRIQLAFRASSIHFLLQNHVRVTPRSNPDWLAPFHLDQSDPVVQEVGMIVLDRIALITAIGRGDGDSISCEVSATPELDMLEFACLTYQPVVEPFDVSLKLSLKDVGLFESELSHSAKTIAARRKKLPRLDGSLDCGNVFLRLSQSAIHTLSTSLRVWENALSSRPATESKDAIVPSYFVICNDTNRRLRFGQADTDEEVAVEKRKAVGYSWRSQQIKKLVRFAISANSGQNNLKSSHYWTDPVDVNVVGLFGKSIRTCSGIVHLVIRVSAVTSVQKKVVVSGQLIFSSRLNQHLELKVTPTEYALHEKTEFGGVLGGKSTIPSFLVDPHEVDGVKFRVMGPSKAPWTELVSLSSLKDTTKPHTINVSYHGSQDQMQIAMTTFVREVDGISQQIVILSPLVCVRTHLPSSLVMELTPLDQAQPPAFVSSRKTEIKGRGSVSQLHQLSSSELVQLSFQLSASHRKSEPSLKLTPEMFSGYLPETTTPPSIDADPFSKCHDWDDNALSDSWPYTHSSRKSAVDKGFTEEVGSQILPDIDLSINISQCWSDLPTLLIDVKPWALMTNQTAMPLALLDGNGDQWMIASEETIAPPNLEDHAFQIGLHHMSQMHYSGHVALLKTESRLGWSDDEENALPLEGVVFIRIYIPSESTKDYHRECRLSLTSTVRNGVRILDVKPQFSLINRSEKILHLRLHSIPFTHQKVYLNPLKSSDCFISPNRPISTSLDSKSLRDLGDAESARPERARRKGNDKDFDGESDDNEAKIGVPLLMWNQQANLCVSASGPSENVLYLDFSIDDNSDAVQSPVDPPSPSLKRWSIPVRLRYDESATHRVSFTVPYFSSSPSSSSRYPLLLTSTEVDGVIRLAVDVDLHPQILLHNLSTRRLCFGETSYSESLTASSVASTTSSSAGVEPKECRELVNQLPTLDPLESVFYTFPILDETFPSMELDLSKSVRLNFALAVAVASGNRNGRNPAEAKLEEDADSGRLSVMSNPHFRDGQEESNVGEEDPCFAVDMERLAWSSGVDVFSPEDVFVHVPDCGDFRVQSEREGNLLHVSLTPITRAEVSAKEVRSRIRGSSGDDLSLRRPPPMSQITSALASPSSRASPSFFPRSLASAESFDDGSSYIDFDDGRKSVASTDDQNVGLYSPPHRLDGEEDTEEAFEPHWLLSLASCQITANLHHACVIVLDELRRIGSSVEVFRMTFDEVVVAAASSSSSIASRRLDSKPKFFTPNSLRLFVGIADFQFDNQTASEAGYDFPVILLARDKNDSLRRRRSSSYSSRVILDDLVSELKEESLFCADLEFTLRRHVDSFVLDILEFQLFSQPTVVYCEDVFLRDLFGVIESFVPHLLIPSRRRSSSLTLSTPQAPPPPSNIRIRHLALHPLNLLLSLHASLKLYIAADQSPLSFGTFERYGIHCDAPTLLRALVMHYVTGTLFRAGWVIGSLELLGSPTGLVRSLGQGISDFVQMPYQGLNSGPKDFLQGVSAGSSSLVKHISGGMLTSMTNFASSVSRNMDRLSLDSDHLKRQEMLRRQSPEGVTSGLYQGLTGLGLSVLGAVAGVADQPLQGLFAIAGGERQLSGMQMISQATTGVVSGVGKGLAGVVTKPIGGAAEFVAQTGSGLLQGTGLQSQPQPRYVPICSELSLGFSSPLKFQWKIFNVASRSGGTNPIKTGQPDSSSLAVKSVDDSERVVFALETIKGNSGGLSIPCHLVLTTSALYVISHKEDTQQQAFAISEINCFSRDSDDSLIYLEPIQRENDTEASANKDRLAEYIQEVAMSSRPAFSPNLDFSSLDSSVGGSRFDSAPSNDQLARNCFQSTSKRLHRVRGSHDASYSTTKRLSLCHQFYIDPNLHDLFLAVVHQTKNNRVDRKFEV